MNNIQKRFILFLVFCIGTRLLLTLFSKNINKKYLPYLGILTFIMGIGFIYIFMFGSKTADKQLDWANGKVWWDDYRVIHGLLYLIFSISAFMKLKGGYLFLGLDTLIGLVVFLSYHYQVGNFNKVF